MCLCFLPGSQDRFEKKYIEYQSIKLYIVYNNMESCKSTINKRLDSVVRQNSPTSSSPLRRKSVAFQNTPSSAFSENDDAAERIARRREIFTPSSPNTTSSTNRRHSLGLGFLANIPAPQMAESITQCIKLSAENKINIKNAFSLAMIDFMTYMIKKQDANMSNLQVASTSLDVSTKIYGFRVDSVHTQILKIVGGLDKQAVDDTERDAEELEEDAENAEANVAEKRKKKKKKAKQKIFNTVEALRGNIEITKPTLMMIGEGDSQTSDMLYQATLPHHANSGFYQHLYNDVLVDVVENESGSQNSSDIKYSTPMIDDFSNLEICASYSNFEFLGWSMEDEPEENLAEETEHNDQSNRFQFDLDASVELDDDNNPLPEPMNYFDFQHDDDNNVNGCRQEAANRRDENILDVRNVQIPAANTFEYSFIQPNMHLHWAGPSHWKFRNFARPSADVAVGTKVMEACKQAPLRKRRQIELLFDENCDVIDAKFALSQSNKLQAKTAKTEWNIEDLILPEDVHYDIAQVMKFYLIPRLILKPSNDGKEDGTNAVAAVDVSDNERYDYNNPNDTLEYCPDANNGDDYDDGDRDDCNFEDDAVALASQNFVGDNLVTAPKLANKISIEYCLRAKKIDMRQLKKSIWKICTSDNVDLININEAENTEVRMKESKKFSDVYKMLPRLLTKTNTEALSVPISFISLLHLANEKTLKLQSLSDLSDIIIEAG